MILEKGNIWTIFYKTDIFVFTANSIVKPNGKLVMGKGIAGQVKWRLSGIDKVFGEIVTQRVNNENLFGFVYTYIKVDDKLKGIGAFQTKVEFWKDSRLDVIKYATDILIDRIEIAGWEHKRIDMTFPGIGNGNLNREDVLPIIEVLPNNVHIWEFK